MGDGKGVRVSGLSGGKLVRYSVCVNRRCVSSLVVVSLPAACLTCIASWRSWQWLSR